MDSAALADVVVPYPGTAFPAGNNEALFFSSFFLMSHMTKCTLAGELIIPCTSGFQ